MNRSDLNPLQQELARGHQGKPHPDPDLLTAFAEGALLERERRQLLDHLAVCAECREVLFVAAEAAPETAAAPKLFLVPRRALPPRPVWVPWASIAAGLLVVCSATLLYQQIQTLQKHAEVAVNEPEKMPAANAQLGQAAVHGPSAQNNALAYAPSALSSAAQERTSPFASTSAQRPHWRINGIGQAERSIGDDAWQSVLPREQSKMRVVSVFGNDVWIGGENARLYHSTDNGATWKLAALPSKDGRTRAIAHIRFQSAQSGVVEAEDGILWTTSNGGVTWN